MKTAIQKAILRGKAMARCGTRGLDVESVSLWAREQLAAALVAETEGAELDALRLTAAALEAKRMARFEQEERA